MARAFTYESIRQHLGRYSVYTKRRTTINHAFASALAAADDFDPERIKTALAVLDQDPDHLKCVYCSRDASTWDHLYALVKAEKYAGRGHRIGNLVPCCKTCNSAKGGKDWRAFAELRGLDDAQIDRIAKYEELLPEVCDQATLTALYPDLMSSYAELRTSVNSLLKVADGIAMEIRRLEAERAASSFGS